MEQYEEELDYEDDEVQEEDIREVSHRGAAPDNANRRKCDICQHRFTMPRNHTLQTHLPWYVAPDTACWICGTQQINFIDKHVRERHSTNQIAARFTNRDNMYVELINGLFHELARLLEVTFPAGLEDTINRHMRKRSQKTPTGTKRKMIQKPPTEFMNYEKHLADLFMSLNNLAPLQNYRIPKPPNMKIQHLIHWKILKNIITELSEDDQLWILTFEERKNYDGTPIPSEYETVEPEPEPAEVEPNTPAIKSTVHIPVKPIPVADAHCHLDQLCKRDNSVVHYKLDTLSSMEEYNTRLDIIIANFVYPNLWPSSSKRSEYRKDSTVYFSYGIHPRLITKEPSNSLIHNFTELQNLIKSTRAVAVGECGLDTTDNPSSYELQKQIVYFRKQIQLAVDNNLTLVIHSRGKPEIHHQILDCIISICPSSQRIHWHCFTGSLDIYLSATEKFENIYFGITPFILKTRYPAMKKIVQIFGLERLLLESDAPYIPLPSTDISNPFVVHPVAREISEICCVPVQEVFNKTTENCRKVYNLI